MKIYTNYTSHNHRFNNNLNSMSFSSGNEPFVMSQRSQYISNNSLQQGPAPCSSLLL